MRPATRRDKPTKWDSAVALVPVVKVPSKRRGLACVSRLFYNIQFSAGGAVPSAMSPSDFVGDDASLEAVGKLIIPEPQVSICSSRPLFIGLATVPISLNARTHVLRIVVAAFAICTASCSHLAFPGGKKNLGVCV